MEIVLTWIRIELVAQVRYLKQAGYLRADESALLLRFLEQSCSHSGLEDIMALKVEGVGIFDCLRIILATDLVL